MIAIFLGMSVPAEVTPAEHRAFEAEAARAADEEAEALQQQADVVGGLNQMASDGTLPKLGVGSVVISAAPGVLLSAKSSLLGPRYAGAAETSGYGVEEEEEQGGTVSPYKAPVTLHRTHMAREESW